MKNENGNGGIGFLGLLGITFIVLKLLGVINWSWFYVTMPIWGGTVLIISILVFIFAVCLVINYEK